MAGKLKAINTYRPTIAKQGELNLKSLARQVARHSTFSEGEIHGIIMDAVQEMIEGLKNGYSVRIDGLLMVAPNMKVGGQVNLRVLVDRVVGNTLNTPGLWTANKVRNWEHMTKDAAGLVAVWDKEHPDDKVTE
jgi:hypothetical protein